MLAEKTDGKDLRYPCLCSPKLDGVRALVVDSVVLSRSLEPIPNKHVQELFGHAKFNGLDGELIVGDVTDKKVFQVSQSGVMSHDGKPEVTFFVFDDFTHDTTFKRRLARSKNRAVALDHVHAVPHVTVRDYDQLIAMENTVVENGYEGLMIRDPDGMYKHGRSTLNQGWLLKLKRFEDSEAKILEVVELMRNTNEAKINALGYTERSSKRSGKKGAEMLGSIKVFDTKTGVEFSIGTGFTEGLRKKLWSLRETLPGQLVKYRYQASGMKDKPRFPSFLGFRDRRDT